MLEVYENEKLTATVYIFICLYFNTSTSRKKHYKTKTESKNETRLFHYSSRQHSTTTSPDNQEWFGLVWFGSMAHQPLLVINVE